MKKKLTKSQLKKYRKKLKPSDVLERNLLNAFRKVFSFKKQDLITINELADQAQSFNYTGIARYIQRIAQDIVNRNNIGFVDVVKSLITGSRGMDSTRQQELNKALQDTIKQRKIYVPLMRKFEENVSLIKNIPMDVIQELRNKYAAGVSFRGTDIEQYLTKRLGNRARLIIRTESSKLNAALTEVRARNLGISAFIWSTSEDRRVRPSHKIMDGVVVFYGNILSLDKMIGYAGEYPNCFTGDTKIDINNNISKIYKREYTGEFVTVELEDGTSFTCTINHPIKTLSGFKSAVELTCMDCVIKVSSNVSDYVRFDDLYCTNYCPNIETIDIGKRDDFHKDGNTCITTSILNVDLKKEPQTRILDSDTLQVRKITRFWDTRYVYNVETKEGEYLVNGGILVGNCRCVALPIVTLEDIKFPVKVAVGDLYIETRKNKAVIVSGQIRTFTKQQFIQQYGKYFPDEL